MLESSLNTQRKGHEEEDSCVDYNFTNRLDHNINNSRSPIYLCRREHTFFKPLEHQLKDFGPWQISVKKQASMIILCICLNIGVDPPGHHKTHPCTTKECWIDVDEESPGRSLEMICKRLHAQYTRWAPKSEYQILRDATHLELEEACSISRRQIENNRSQTENSRVLFHYNGHGCPEPTEKGEFWVFDSEYTKYVPVSIWDLIAWLNSPSVLIFDCNNAERIIRIYDEQRSEGCKVGPYNYRFPDSVILAACSADEDLPNRPYLPADLFTACLTTPIKTSVVWYISQNLLNETGTQTRQRKKINLLTGITDEIIEYLFDPVLSGQYTNRRSPLGELNWVFTAITDTIAYEVLPHDMFHRLFRSDLVLAPLMRNYLLADRIMRSVNRTPCTFPKIPDTSKSLLWQEWDLAIETALHQLKFDLFSAEGKTILFPPICPPTIQLKPLEASNCRAQSQLIPPGTRNLLSELNNIMNRVTSESHLSNAVMRKLTLSTSRCISGLEPKLLVVYNRVLKSHSWDGKFYKEALSKRCIKQLYTSLKLVHDGQRRTVLGKRPWVPLSFFPDQMTAFENWLDCEDLRISTPIQLPIVLQSLLSQQHRPRSIELLCRFVDLGAWAIHKVLVVGIYPHIFRLIVGLSDPPRSLQKGLVFLWSKVIVFDPNKARSDIINSKNLKALKFFIGHLRETNLDEPEWLVTGFHILATLADGCAKGQRRLQEEGVLELAASVLKSDAPAKVLSWASLCIAKIWECQNDIAWMCHKELHLPEVFVNVLQCEDILYRACSVHTLSCFLTGHNSPGSVITNSEKLGLDLAICKQVAKSFCDGSALVRYVIIQHIARLISIQWNQFVEIVGRFTWEREQNRRHCEAGVEPSTNTKKILAVKQVRLVNTKHCEMKNGSPLSVDEDKLPCSESTEPPVPEFSEILKSGDQEQWLRSSTSTINRTYDEDARRFIWRVVRVLSADPVQQVRQIAKGLIVSVYDNVTSHQTTGKARGDSLSNSNKSATCPYTDHTKCSCKDSTMTVENIHSLQESVLSQTNVERSKKYSPKSHLFKWICDSMLDSRYEGNWGPHCTKRFHFSDEDAMSLSTSKCNMLIPFAKNSPDHQHAVEEKRNLSMQYIKKSVDRNYREYRCNRDESEFWGTPSKQLFKRQAILNIKAESLTAMCIHEYEPIVYTADNHNRIGIWNYESAFELNCFKGNTLNSRGCRITNLKIINQLYDSLLLTGSDDGQVLIWKNSHNCEMQKVISGFVTNVADRRRSYSVDTESRHDKLVMKNNTSKNAIKSRSMHKIMKFEWKKSALEWDQDNGLLHVGANMLRLFDLRREQFTRDIKLRSHVSALTLYSTDTVLGSFDGSIQLIDHRLPNACSLGVQKLHDQRVVRVCVQGSQIHSVDPTGFFVISDVRKLAESREQLARMRFNHGLTSFSSHHSSPLIAVGSSKQCVNLFRTNVLTESLRKFQQINFPKGFLRKRYKLVTHLEFHRSKGILFAGCNDSRVSIFSSDTNPKSRKR